MPDYRAFDALADVGGVDAVPDRTPLLTKEASARPAKNIAEAQIHTSASQQKEQIVSSIARPAFPRTERRDRLTEVLAEHYGPEVQIVNGPYLPSPLAFDTYEPLGITYSEFEATARLIAEITTCTVGDASNQLEVIGAAIEVMSR